MALIGPPNSGKSTLFNRLTRLRQKVGNYPGITVEQRVGLLAGGGPEIKLIDLPGVYSLTPYSEDERVAVNVLTGKMDGLPRPDAILLVLDVTHLSRQLVLAAPVIALGLPTLVLLNMADVFAKGGGSLDVPKLAAELGAPVAMVSAAQGTGWKLWSDSCEKITIAASKRCCPFCKTFPQCRNWANQLSSRIDYQRPFPSLWTRRLDDIFLHKLWGPLIFMIVVGAVFQTVFGLGQPMSNAFQDLLTKLGLQAAPFIPDGMLRSLCGWPLEGRQFRARVPAPDPSALPLYWVAGGFGLSGPRRADCRPHYAKRGIEREGVHSSSVRVCVRRSRNHGDAHHRE